MLEVVLTPAEMFTAAVAGIMRQVENIAKGRSPAYGAGRDIDWQLNIEGCLGEMALAKFVGAYWSGKGGLRDPDVGGGIDVRCTPHATGRLILHNEDDDNRPFWLVIGINGRYRIAGWCYGREGKRDEFWDDPTQGRPAYFVPQSSLRLPEEWDDFRRQNGSAI